MSKIKFKTELKEIPTTRYEEVKIYTITDLKPMQIHNLIFIMTEYKNKHGTMTVYSEEILKTLMETGE